VVAPVHGELRFDRNRPGHGIALREDAARRFGEHD
jgi:hypothetical protein